MNYRQYPFVPGGSNFPSSSPPGQFPYQPFPGGPNQFPYQTGFPGNQSNSWVGPDFPGDQPGYPGDPWGLPPGIPMGQPEIQGIPGGIFGGFPGGPDFPGDQPGYPEGQPGMPDGPPPFGAPNSPPPSFTPQKSQVSVYAVDPGGIRGCLYRNTYVWLQNGRSFWYYPTYVGRTSVSGWRWRRRYGWVYYGTDLRNIESFQCF